MCLMFNRKFHKIFLLDQAIFNNLILIKGRPLHVFVVNNIISAVIDYPLCSTLKRLPLPFLKIPTSPFILTPSPFIKFS